MSGHLGVVVWLVGLPGSGKSTVATALESELRRRGCHVVTLDGDRFRRGVSADLGYSHRDRTENIRRAAEVAALLASAGTVVITAFISPRGQDRTMAKRIVLEHSHLTDFIEIYLSASLSVCESRDPKGLYQRARTGQLQEFTGVSAPFDPPHFADVVVDTGTVSLADTIEQILDYLRARLPLATADATRAREIRQAVSPRTLRHA